MSENLGCSLNYFSNDHKVEAASKMVGLHLFISLFCGIFMHEGWFLSNGDGGPFTRCRHTE